MLAKKKMPPEMLLGSSKYQNSSNYVTKFDDSFSFLVPGSFCRHPQK